MVDKKFSAKEDFGKLPMTQVTLSEGANGLKLVKDVVAFDIETFSPNGFPEETEDPIVNFSLVAPIAGKGILCISAIGHQTFEGKLLYMLKEWLLGFSGAHIITYNGAKFDLDYVTRRGELYGLNFQDAFCRLQHMDVYRLIKWFNIKFPNYNQKSVEKCFRQHLPHFLQKIHKKRKPRSMFYNIEDSIGCIKIVNAIASHSRREVNFLF